MVTWCLEHPWLTSGLVLYLLSVIDVLQANYFKYKLAKLNINKPEIKREEIEEQYKNFYNENQN